MREKGWEGECQTVDLFNARGERHRTGSYYTPDFVVQYIYSIEEAVIRTVALYGIEATRDPQATGVWIDVGKPSARKICAIGVKSSRFVTMHGFALNINTDLEYFKHINPCGFSDKGVTSLEKELGSTQDFERAKKLVLEIFSEVFGSTLV